MQILRSKSYIVSDYAVLLHIQNVHTKYILHMEINGHYLASYHEMEHVPVRKEAPAYLVNRLFVLPT